MADVHRRVMTGLAAALAVITASAALAGTTGSIRGHIFDTQTNVALADARVSAVSASQRSDATTTASGGFIFVSLAPDTYNLTVTKTGYNTVTRSGLTVLADQTQDVALGMQRSIATLGRISVSAASGLLKPGTTSDIYSVNAVGAEAAKALGGPGGIDQAYSAMLSVPGINIPQGQQGWYQTVYIRGGDQDQVGWELDGIPANRSYDNAPMTLLSNLGQQELQVYTGGTLATADASGIAGYVNQVIKRGTYPGFADIVLGIGFPSYYNKYSLEFGGASADSRFSYYAGFAAAFQNYRYIDQSNGASAGGYFYPLNIPSNFPGNVNAGSEDIYQGGSPLTFSPGQSYGIYQTRDHENVVNLHYALPHRNDVGSDDLQFLYVNSYLQTLYYSSILDQGGQANVYSNNGGAVINWQDGRVYTGQVYAPLNNVASNFPLYFFPSSPAHQPFSPLPLSQEDGNQNSVSIEKLQYQRNFNSRSYLRIFGYWLYSDWFINGPLSNFLSFGAEVADYELPVHQYGISVSYTDQLNDQNLLSASVYQQYAKVQRYSTTNGFPGSTCGFGSGVCTSASTSALITNVINPAGPLGACYNSAGAIASCFDSANRGTLGNPAPFAPINGQWWVTANGYRANLNQVDPLFSSVAVSDNWKPNDRYTVSLGVRFENYTFFLPDTVDGYPARAFWFAAYNREYCLVPGVLSPERNAMFTTQNCATTFGPGATAVNLTNQSGGTQSNSITQPRLGLTYQAGANDVLRGSYGLYARPPDSRDAAYNTTQQDLASFVGTNLVPYGYMTPQKPIYPDRSWNADASWEHHFANTTTSFKLTPFYRSTQNQLQQFVLNPLTGLFGSINDGHQTSTGVEFALSMGNFASNGWAGTLAYTHTRSQIVYTNFVNGRNVIDNVNTYITQYNQYTAGCAGLATAQCSTNGLPNTLGFQCFTAGVGHNGACALGDITNPYYSLATQPLLNRSAAYTTYDLIPSPFAAANGYATPDVASLVVQYKHGPLTVTPSLTYSSGASYGSPLSVPGYAPDTCTAKAGTNTADTTTCGSFVFIPDQYTNQFDNLGAFKQPSRITLNLQLGYQITPSAKATLTMTGLVDQCNQRGYAWDYSTTCVYSSLPSSILPPVGNFLTPAATPVQLKYPYAMWLNNNNTGAVGVKNPFQAALTFEFKPSL